jgi:iron complex outermembrane receptor protein
MHLKVNLMEHSSLSNTHCGLRFKHGFLSCLLFIGIFPTVSFAADNDTLEPIQVKAAKVSVPQTAPGSVERSLAENPAITFIRRGPSAAEPVVRGASGNDILVTLDGARVQTACTDHMDPLTSYTCCNNLDRISIDAGSNAIASGAPALGKVNLVLKRSQPGAGRFEWSAGSKISSIDTGIIGNGSLTWKTPRIAVDLNASAKRIENYSEPGGAVVSNSGLRAANFLATSTVQADSGTKLRGTFLYDKFWNAGYPALPMDVGYSELVNGAIGIEHVRKNGNSVEGLLYANNTSHAMDDTHRKNIAMHMDMPGSGSTIGGWTLLKKPFKSHNPCLRLEAWQGTQSASMTMYDIDNNPSMYLETWPLTRTTGINGALSDEVKLTDDWLVNGSLIFENRFIDVLSKLGKRQILMLQPAASMERNFPVPGLQSGIRFVPSENREIGLSISASQRAPAMDELYGYYLFNASTNRDYIGNALLDPENICQADISGKIRSGILETSGSLWSTVKDNVIEAVDVAGFSPMTDGAYGVRQWRNKGRELKMGIETDIRLKPWEFFEFSSVARYMYGKTLLDSHVPQIPYTGGKAIATFMLPYVNVSPELEWAPSQNRPDPLLVVATSKGYAIPHLRLSGQIPGSVTVLWRIGVENVFNRKWRTNMDWDNYTTKKPLYQPGRNFYLDLTFARK